ncbi:MAG TPA: hypothetical protein VLJ17_24825 [Xanthobacteraceae bacterium]|nr:hypothetical protein [Xanthobacteraceae bacterium]
MKKFLVVLACCLALWLPVDAKAQSAQYNCNPCTPTHLANWLGTGILGDAGTSFSAQTQGANASQFAQISVLGIPNLYFDNLVHIRSLGAAPTLTSCGTSPSVSGSDVSGTITMGTGSPTGCTATFAQAYLNAPNCVVTWQTNIASMQYTVTASALTLVQTATSSNKVNYFCFAGSNG